MDRAWLPHSLFSVVNRSSQNLHKTLQHSGEMRLGKFLRTSDPLESQMVMSSKQHNRQSGPGDCTMVRVLNPGSVPRPTLCAALGTSKHCLVSWGSLAPRTAQSPCVHALNR